MGQSPKLSHRDAHTLPVAGQPLGTAVGMSPSSCLIWEWFPSDCTMQHSLSGPIKNQDMAWLIDQLKERTVSAAVPTTLTPTNSFDDWSTALFSKGLFLSACDDTRHNWSARAYHLRLSRTQCHRVAYFSQALRASLEPVNPM